MDLTLKNINELEHLNARTEDLPAYAQYLEEHYRPDDVFMVAGKRYSVAQVKQEILKGNEIGWCACEILDLEAASIETFVVPFPQAA